MQNNYSPNLGFGQGYQPGQMPMQQGMQQMPMQQGYQPQQYQPQPYGSNQLQPYGNQPYGGGYQPNPYLQQQAQGIAQDATQNYLNVVAPQVRSGAVAAGGYGGSRQGIAEGLAQQGLNRDIVNAQAKLFGSAYESDANRRSAQDIARMQNETTMRGQDVTKELGYAGFGNQKDIANLNAETARYGTDVNASTAMRGQDINRDLGYAGLTNQKDIAGMQSETSRYGYDKSAEASMYGADRSAEASMTNARTSADASRYGSDQSAAASRYASDATYNLGMGNLGYNYAGLDRAIANDNVANTIAMGNFGLNAYDRMMGYEGSGVTAGNNIQNTPLDYYTRFAGAANAAGGLGGTGSATTPYFGNPLMGAIGGYQLGGAIGRSMDPGIAGPGLGYGAAGTAAGTALVPDGMGGFVYAL